MKNKAVAIIKIAIKTKSVSTVVIINNNSNKFDNNNHINNNDLMMLIMLLMKKFCNYTCDIRSYSNVPFKAKENAAF